MLIINIISIHFTSVQNFKLIKEGQSFSNCISTG